MPTTTRGSLDSRRPGTVVYFDHLGTGRSERLADPSRYTIPLYAEAIDALRAHLGFDRISLVGLSFGGMPAIQ